MESRGSIHVQYYNSPFGELILGSYGDSLCLCDWNIKERRKRIDDRLKKFLCAEYEKTDTSVLKNVRQQLDEYIRGKRKIFDIPLLFAGSDFQKRVWRNLLDIPYGETVSYGSLAEMIGNRNAVRAVAAANGANAISIFVPCHRVIGSDGSLTGYAGGLEAKRWLLNLEKQGMSFDIEQ